MGYIFTSIRALLKRQKGGLESDGERVDIVYDKTMDFVSSNMYEQSHYRRYEFARGLLENGWICGDFACGTGYGSMMLAEKAQHVIGIDLNGRVIKQIAKRYAFQPKVAFKAGNLLNLDFSSYFDAIVSFETLEHFDEQNIMRLLMIYHHALKPKGMLIFSTPFMQEASPAALKMGFHKTFLINETKIRGWLQRTDFTIRDFHYQDYKTHTVVAAMEKPDFIIGTAVRT